MSLHKITAGHGYDYLTRQVARHDSSEDARPSLTSYYTEKGEVPGRWVGSGLAGLGGLVAGDEVTEVQMQRLFGAGYHPLHDELQARLVAAGASPVEVQRAGRLGRPFPVYPDDISTFRVEVARAFDAYNRSQRLRGDAPLPLAVRARIRGDIAREMFRDEFGREPLDARELSGHLARLSRQQTTAVAGYDLTFSPVKSVSAWWALADPVTAATIERAHQAAVADALAFLEARALFTREGPGGVRQVEVRGLIGAAFTHRDSRAGDPDLHTHVAVANKVQTHTGRWLAIDGRVLYKAAVTASEVYNTALERRLADTLGVVFTERRNTLRSHARPVRELVGIPAVLLERWSTRRAAIEQRRGELAADFQDHHDRPPTPVEQIALAQQATLETRDAKHGPRSLPEQRTGWRREAVAVLGGRAAVDRMLAQVRSPHPDRRQAAVGFDEAWLAGAAARLVQVLEGHRATWQDWHVRAEAYRHLRTAQAPHDRVDDLVEALVARVLTVESTPVTPVTGDPVSEPRVLRRSDGTSMYAVAGARRYTSTTILAAEQRLVAAAGRCDGLRIDDTTVDVALLEQAANGVTLNPGQAALVRGLATSGARLQVAIAPAGSGKTTAMAALAAAWVEAGGDIVGFAPSAAAATQLGDHLGHPADTLAQLTWHLDHGGPLPAGLARIGPATLVVVDEAGMADTLSLDRAVSWLLDQGASVRLIGDDQQLAAIGAGGVLRDIEATHGVLRLRDLVRFTDPAEAAAGLALREGRPEALGFYLDHHRVHVGDQTTLLDDLFDAWTIDRRDQLDSIMLAGTRDLVAQLNQRARHLRLDGHHPDQEVTLADGNQASTGDTIITRLNNRQLRLSATDWVKNGDRWTVTGLNPDGSLTARHVRSGLWITLPAGYVTQHTELGYATTIHAAQGVTADTVHGLADPGLARQALYTMLTRGRAANHLYLEVVGDGSEHTRLRPETINPLTPTDLLEGILARDDAPWSATSQTRHATAPTTRLYEAAGRYTDAVQVAAETLAGPAAITALERKVEAVTPGLTTAPDWPALRAQLLVLAADGHEPVTALVAAAQQRPLGDTRDPAAVLAWRLDGLLPAGPLPWLHGLPRHLADHPHWGPYLTARHHLVDHYATQVAATARTSGRPAWLTGSLTDPSPSTLADLTVWRAAVGVPDSDLRPTGPHQPGAAAQRWQQALDRRAGEDHNPALAEWAPLLRRLAPAIGHDPYTPTLARLLAQLAGTGHDASTLARTAANEGPLPDDHAAAALWWRITRHLTADTTRTLDTDTRIPDHWQTTLTHHLGPDLAHRLQASPSWPALEHAIETALQRGWTLTNLLAGTPTSPPPDGVDPTQTLTWRIVAATDPTPTDAPADPAENLPPDDLNDGYQPPTHPTSTPATPTVVEEPYTDLDLGLDKLIRAGLPTPEFSDVQIREQLARRDAWHDSGLTPHRLEHINALTRDFYTRHLTRPGGWARPYLASRFGVDLAGDPIYQPGYAPAGWTTLVDHLHHHGITDPELLAAGVATTASTGRLLDRFRDRLVFPLHHPDTAAILGFVGRANPASTDLRTPKYLNTGDTLLYHKGHQLFLPPIHPTTHPDAPLVLVEGPLDAIAVTLATHGHYLGAAALGTALTDDQARQLHTLGRDLIIATDNDPAGRAAAERDFWLLTPYGLQPRYAQLPDGTDPADLIRDHQHHVLTDALRAAQPLAHHLLTQRLTTLPRNLALPEAIKVIAAQPPDQWEISEAALLGALAAPTTYTRLALKEAITTWNQNPHTAAQQFLHDITTLTTRLNQARNRNHPAQPETPEPPQQPRPHPIPEHDRHHRHAISQRGAERSSPSI